MSEFPGIESSRSPREAKRRSVLITGRGTDVAFNLDDEAPLEQLADELSAHLAGQSSLYSRGGISINTGSRTLSHDEEAEIRRIFKEKSGLQISRFISGSADVAVQPEIDVEEPPAVRHPATPSKSNSKSNSKSRLAPLDQDHVALLSSADLARALSGISRQGQRSRSGGMVVRGTVRSGEAVQHFGDLVVLGDVNPGSEVVADGDIVVMGSLKGLPHAGAAGDEKAAIIALTIASPRLRIGDCEASGLFPHENPVGRNRKADSRAAQPTIAYVRRKSIYVSPFAGRFARYTEGVPYEG